MLQFLLGNQGVVLFGAVRIQEIQNIASVGANTWTAEETGVAKKNHKTNSKGNKTISIIQNFFIHTEKKIN